MQDQNGPKWPNLWGMSSLRRLDVVWGGVWNCGEYRTVGTGVTTGTRHSYSADETDFFWHCQQMTASVVCGLVVRVPGYTTEMYCVSCEVRTEFIYVM
jgi:hypothetical protein